ncbi:hypothetical protein G3Q33_001140 [Neisseria gonorrhoeae]
MQRHNVSLVRDISGRLPVLFRRHGGWNKRAIVPYKRPPVSRAAGLPDADVSESGGRQAYVFFRARINTERRRYFYAAPPPFRRHSR